MALTCSSQQAFFLLQPGGPADGDGEKKRR
jgi:hypothetical protein